MEAAIFGMRIGLESFRKLGFAAQEIRLAGGGAKSRLWRQIAANVTGLPVRVPEEEEAAAFGAAIQALWCHARARGSQVGIEELADIHVSLVQGSSIEPEQALVSAYEETYREYMKYLEALSPLYR